MDTDRYNVLLIDDDYFQVDLARRAAVETRPVVSLTAVAGGDVALEWFGAGIEKSEKMPHIILLDLKLPKLDGLAVLRKLRSFPATNEIPIVVFSTEFTQADVLMSYKAGANSFVAKPCDIAGYAELFHERLAYWMQAQQRKLPFSGNDESTERI